MKKRKVALVLSLVLVLGAVSLAGAAGLIEKINAEIRRDFTIKLDGDAKVLKNVKGEEVYPVLYNGTTYLPVRAIGELFGKTVYWDEGKKEVDLRTEKADEASTVTDADVIYNSKDDKVKDKAEKPKKASKPVKEEKPADESAFIGEEKAKRIALEKAGVKEADAKFVKVKLDFDNGAWEYEVEFKAGLKEYEADIHAETGEILKWEVDFFD